MKRDFVIFSSDADYASFPGIIRMTDGIAVAFTRQPLEELRLADVHPHCAPVAELTYSVSRDDGHSWTVVDRLPDLGGAEHATRHGHIVDFALDGGQILRMSKGYRRGTTTPLPTRVEVLRGDTPFISPLEIRHFGPFADCHPFDVERLSDGSLLAGGYWYGKKSSQQEESGGAASLPRNNTAFFIRGTPDGRDWSYCSHIPNTNPFCFTEMDLLDMGGGRVICLLRTDWIDVSIDSLPPEANGNGTRRDGYGYFLYQAESTDFGNTWSVPRRLPIWGHPPFCIALHSGRVLLVWGHRRPPFEIRALLSADGCRSWDLSTMTVLHRFDPGSYDIGYPVCTELHDGTIFCVFYGYSSGDVSEKTAHAIFASAFTEDYLLGKEGEPLRPADPARAGGRDA